MMHGCNANRVEGQKPGWLARGFALSSHSSGRADYPPPACDPHELTTRYLVHRRRVDIPSGSESRASFPPWGSFGIVPQLSGTLKRTDSLVAPSCVAFARGYRPRVRSFIPANFRGEVEDHPGLGQPASTAATEATGLPRFSGNPAGRSFCSSMPARPDDPLGTVGWTARRGPRVCQRRRVRSI